jgi:excisionase family DNA binding protein
MAVISDSFDTVLNKDEVEEAKAAQRCIVASLDHSKAVSIALVAEDGVERLEGSPVLRLPPKVLRLFADMLGNLAQGKSVAILPREMDLTTQEAALFLNVSRPYLIRLLEEGKIAFHKVGKHRRVLFKDIVAYKEARSAKSLDALAKLAEEAQELGLGY